MAQHHQLFEGKVLGVELRTTPARAPEGALSLTRTGPTVAIRMQVLRTYRGSVPSQVVVTQGGTTCDFDFDTDELYLVDAQILDIDTGELFTSICSATSRLDEAGPELRVLRNEPPVAEDLLDRKTYYEQVIKKGPKICGRVSRSDSTPLGSFIVTVWKVHEDFRHARKVDIAETDKRTKTFCSSPLPPGKYFVGGEDGEFWKTNTQYRGYHSGASRFIEATPIILKHANTFNDADLVLHPEPLHYVRGRIRDAQGRFFGPGAMTVIIVSAEKDLLFDPQDRNVEGDGSFQFWYVPKGKYLLIAEDTKQEVTIAGNVDDLILQLK
jgi:hypothetical protein